MAISSKYIVLGVAGDDETFIDFAMPYGGLSLDGQEIQYLGSAYVDTLFVRPGSAYWLNTGSGADRIYFGGAFADYTVSTSASTLVLTREAGGKTETVMLAGANSPRAPDELVFSDGSVTAYNTFNHVAQGASSPVPSGDTSLAPTKVAAPGAELSALVKVALFDPDGETVALTKPGVAFQVLGNSGTDVVYIAEGTQVDASALGGGVDIVYFRGAWADYAKSAVTGTIALTREIGGMTEQVVVAGSGGSRNDLLVFADGAVRSSDAAAALRADPEVAISAIPTYDPGIFTDIGPTIAGFLDPFASTVDAQGNVVTPAYTFVAGAPIVQPGGASIHGSSAPGATVSLTLGSALTRDVTADAQGKWSLALTHAELATLGLGEITAQATVRDGAGNSAQAESVLTINAQALTTSAIAPDGYGSAYVDALVVGEAGWTAGTITYAFATGSTAATWTEAEKQAASDALQTYSNVANLTFAEGRYYGDAAQEANIVLKKVPASALPTVSTLAEFSIPFGDLDGTGTDVNFSQIGQFNYQAASWQNLAPGGLGFTTLVHEIGHGLGLGHSFSTTVNGVAQTTFPGVSAGDARALGDFDLSQGVWSVMAYNFGWNLEPPAADKNWGLTTTPMVFDVAAIQRLYGANTSHRTGDDVYELARQEGAGTGWTCIWDAGGTDTISNIGGTGACVINLNAYPLSGGIASTLYVSGNVGISGGYTIAQGAVIENAIGGAGNDIIVGNAASNELIGGQGADRFCFLHAPDWDAIDSILDFSTGEGDKIALSTEAFAALAGLSDLAEEFAYLGADDPQGGTILYDQASGDLHYDASGTGSTGVVFANLATRPTDLSAADFLLI
ncbi:M10 family metallopeptidase C-terminal domain-containing protein [Aurantiacibacter suaedae]|uniref:M10 family metallopeptidase C-terminal domain-containing protein n=1 Tax=Aurantiacibacter suaedae TaxID=2545755 RepID=UPI0010F694E2|nr:M10 family metallopeptidase C-terminal domain-containing protein [Aurantiacibacter suaedae]